MGHSCCEFMNDLYIAEIYRPGTIFVLVTVWVYLHLLLHRELWNMLYGVRWCIMVVQDHSRGHRSWYQSKAHMRLPINLPL